MVQVLPENPSFGAQIARGLGGGISRGLSRAADFGTQLALQKSKSQADLMNELAVQKYKNEERRKLIESIEGSGFQQEKETDINSQLQQVLPQIEEKLGFKLTLDQIQSVGQQLQQGQPSSQNQNAEASKIQEKEVDPFLKAMKYAAAGEKPLSDISAKKAEAILREKREEKTAKEKKIEVLRNETLPIRKEISDRADTARRGIENKQKQLQLIDTGNIDDPTYATFLEALPMHLGQRFLSPETVEYKAGLVQGYGDLKNIFSGATRVKEVEILEQKIADLYLTDQQKKAILKSAIDTQKADLIREEAAAELENTPLSLLQYRKEVEKIAKPKLDALFNKIIDEQNSIIKDAENHKKIALNDADPDDAQIIDQILQEAGGDWRKAEKLAKKKGYKF